MKKFLLLLGFIINLQAVDLQELFNKQSEVLQSNINALTAPQQPKAPVPLATAPPVIKPRSYVPLSEQNPLRLVGIFGVGNRLQAQVMYRGGTIVPVKVGQTIDGWTLRSISPYSVTFYKAAYRRKKYVKHKNTGRTLALYLSSDNSPLASPASMGTSSMDSINSLLPIPITSPNK